MEHTKEIYEGLLLVQEALSEAKLKFVKYGNYYEIEYKGYTSVGLCRLSWVVLSTNISMRSSVDRYLLFRMWGDGWERKSAHVRWTIDSKSGFYSRRRFIDKLIKELEVHYV